MQIVVMTQVIKNKINLDEIQCKYLLMKDTTDNIFKMLVACLFILSFSWRGSEPVEDFHNVPYSII